MKINKNAKNTNPNYLFMNYFKFKSFKFAMDMFINPEVGSHEPNTFRKTKYANNSSMLLRNLN